MESIKTQYDAERDSRRKRLLLGLVSCHMTGAQLKRRGWAVKKSLLRRSRRPVKVPSLPPNCKPLSADTLGAIQMHYLDHCQPAGDRTCYDKTQKSHITVMVRSKTKKQLYRELPSDVQVSYSTFARLQPVNVKQAKRKTDMCELCVAGDACECERDKKRQKTLEAVQGNSSISVPGYSIN